MSRKPSAPPFCAALALRPIVQLLVYGPRQQIKYTEPPEEPLGAKETDTPDDLKAMQVCNLSMVLAGSSL